MNTKLVTQKITKFIQQQAGGKPVVLGLSGGVDSAVVASLAVLALGPNKVMALILPSASNSADDERWARLVAHNLKIKTKKILIDKIVASFEVGDRIFSQAKIKGNLKARIRMSILYGWANKLGALVLGTGNRSELMAGYFTKYGDGGVDLLPIANLYKTQVWELARYLKVPAEIIARPPTAGLWPGQTDENEMGISYEKLDKILMAIENNNNNNLEDFKISEVVLVKKMVANSAHKRAMPMVGKV
jgi:NAD+ synthase